MKRAAINANAYTRYPIKEIHRANFRANGRPQVATAAFGYVLSRGRLPRPLSIESATATARMTVYPTSIREWLRLREVQQRPNPGNSATCEIVVPDGLFWGLVYRGIDA